MNAPRPPSTRNAHRRIACAAAGALLLGLASACESSSSLGLRPGPVVSSQSFGLTAAALAKVAVVPFYPNLPSSAPGASGAGAHWEEAALVSSFVSEALAAQGVPVVAPSDVETAFTGNGTPVPRLDPEATAVRCARDFGATSVTLGRVLRWREREGSAAGSTRPASVSFEVTIYEAPTARRLWIGRFDHTQVSMTADILRARQYPGRGTRWLTAPEFARWGASELATSIVSVR
jgi:hypothetical protein